MAWFDALAAFENGEDGTLAAGLTETDTGGAISLGSTDQEYAGSASIDVNYGSKSATAYIERAYASPTDHVTTIFWYRTLTGLTAWDFGPMILWMGNGAYGSQALYLVDRYIDTRQIMIGRSNGTEVDSVDVVEGTWYGFSVEYVRNGTSVVTIWNADHSVLETVNVASTPDAALEFIRIGAEGTGAYSGEHAYFDDVGIDESNAGIEPWDDGIAPVTGTAAQTQAVATQTATGTETITGSAAQGQGAQAQAATGTETIAGTGVQAQAIQSQAATGEVIPEAVTGTGEQGQGRQIQLGAGLVAVFFITGSAAQRQAVQTQKGEDFLPTGEYRVAVIAESRAAVVAEIAAARTLQAENESRTMAVAG